MKEQFGQQRKELENNLRPLRQKFSEIDTMQKELKKWVRDRFFTATVDSLKKNFDNCIQYRHLSAHKEYIDPIVEDWKNKMSAYTEELLKTREIIRRFDEIMLNKANKFEIERYRAELKNYVTIENLNEYK